MRKSLWKSFLWQIVGLLFYLAGMLLFLIVAINVYLAPPANSLENLSGGDMISLLISVGLIVIGRAIAWKFGGGVSISSMYGGGVMRRGPEQSQLEQMGYKLPTVDSEQETSDVVSEDGEGLLVCPKCGTHNERDYRYCSKCSSELPDA